jgi:signal transduction histidine kinase
VDEFIAELRSTFLFEPFSEEQLYWLVPHSTVVELEPGEYAFTQKQQPDALWVLLSGSWRLSRTVSGREVIMSESSTPGGWAGWLPIFDERVALDLRALMPSRVLRIPSAAVEHMFTSGYPIASHLITGIYQGVQNIMTQTREQEKMIALGKLSAGLAHELNNPASAARSAASDLREVLKGEASASILMTGSGLPPLEEAALAEELRALMGNLDERSATAEALDPLTRSDRTDAIAAWLEEHGVPDGYESAGTMVGAGVDAAWLDAMTRQLQPDQIIAAARAITIAVTAGALVDQIERSTTRISELVGAVKSYSYMDQGSMQDVDVQEGLESTLTMLAHKLRGGITIVRNYDDGIPRIRASGSELNQVWTNLIDNAVDAMDGEGELRLVTRREASSIVVEVADNGSGIPPEIQPRIFEPFFTTKDVGSGSGLGLDIAYRIIVTQHHGDIKLLCTPGETVFKVRLPVNEQDSTMADDSV